MALYSIYKANPIQGGSLAKTEVEAPRQGLENTIKPLTYQGMFEMLNPQPQQVNEEKSKKQRLIANIADGISALNNIVATTKGAYSAKMSPMSEQIQKRHDYLTQIYSQDKDKWYAGMMRARAMDDDKDRAQEASNRWNMEWRNQLEQQKKADDRWDKENKRKQAQHDLNMQVSRQEAEYLPTKQKLETQQAQARINATNASTGYTAEQTRQLRANGSGRGAGNNNYHIIATRDGRKWTIPSQYMKTEGITQLYYGLGFPEQIQVENQYGVPTMAMPSEDQMRHKINSLFNSGKMSPEQIDYMDYISGTQSSQSNTRGLSLGLTNGNTAQIKKQGKTIDF